MNRILSILPVLGLLAVPATAQDAGIPAGVIIYDATPVTQSAVVGTPARVGDVLIAPNAPFNLSADPAPVVQPIQSRASVRSTVVQAPVLNGTRLDPATVAPQVNLAPGETVLEAIAVSPAIVQIPNPQPVYTSRYEPAAAPRVAPPPKRDPVTGRLRDTAGWTGRREAPASIGCFPAGACAILNAR